MVQLVNPESWVDSMDDTAVFYRQDTDTYVLSALVRDESKIVDVDVISVPAHLFEDSNDTARFVALMIKAFGRARKYRDMAIKATLPNILRLTVAH